MGADIGAYRANAKLSKSYLGVTETGRTEVAWGVGSAAFHHYDINSVGRVAKSNARATVDQGIRIVGASPN